MASTRPYTLKARAEAVEQTRARILACARDALFSLPFGELTLPYVAAQAQVTTQTVRNHFESKEGLLRALTEQLSEDLLGARQAAAPVGSAQAAAMLAEEYEAYGHAYIRLVAAMEGSPAMRAMGEHARAEHRRWLEDTFAERLPEAGEHRERAVAALYAATDVGTWRLLRVDLGHSAQTTVAVIRTLIDGVLAPA
jgi:AcrR family transcriptional regulator